MEKRSFFSDTDIVILFQVFVKWWGGHSALECWWRLLPEIEEEEGSYVLSPAHQKKDVGGLLQYTNVQISI